MGKKRGKKNQADDTMSEVSSMMSMSSYRTNRSDTESETEVLDEESQFKAFMEDIGNKNSKTSGPALKFIKSKMQAGPMTTFLSNQKMTLSTYLYRALKKAKGEARLEILRTLSILFISIDVDETASIFEDVQSNLIVAMKDGMKGVPAALSIITANCFNPDDVRKTTEQFRNFFRIAFAKGDKTVPTLKASQVSYCVECLEAWSFLLSHLATVRGFGRFVDEEIDSVIEGLPSILEQDNVDIRIATGEALAICYELARNYRGENWEGFDDEDEILYALEDLAKGLAVGGGSVKSKSKNERKAQKHSFKSYVEFIRDGESPQPRRIQINPQEEFVAESFADLCQYEMLCWCLESGISNHMTFNEILRSNFWFGLGPILPQLTSIDRENTGMSKLEKRVIRGQEGKIRANAIKKGRRNAGDDHYYE